MASARASATSGARRLIRIPKLIFGGGEVQSLIFGPAVTESPAAGAAIAGIESGAHEETCAAGSPTKEKADPSGS